MGRPPLHEHDKTAQIALRLPLSKLVASRTCPRVRAGGRCGRSCTTRRPCEPRDGWPYPRRRPERHGPRRCSRRPTCPTHTVGRADHKACSVSLEHFDMGRSQTKYSVCGESFWFQCACDYRWVGSSERAKNVAYRLHSHRCELIRGVRPKNSFAPPVVLQHTTKETARDRVLDEVKSAQRPNMADTAAS